MNERLSWPRLKTLLRNEAISGYRTWLIASAVIAGVLLPIVLAARAAAEIRLQQMR